MSDVWLIDDSPLERQLSQRALERAHRVRAFDEAASALEALSQGDVPDALVLDWQLPMLTGLEMCRFLRSRPATEQLPILLLSGTHAESEDIVEGLRAGANDYVTKPFSDLELLARVDALLRTKLARERAERAERALRDVLLNLPDPLLALDAFGRISFVNSEAERLFGREVKGKDLSRALPSLAGFDLRAPALPEGLLDVRLGERVFSLALSRLSLNESGDTVTVTLRDVTEKARAIERRDRFLAMLGHELRNPLAASLSALELMRRKANDKSANERAQDIMRRQMERLRRMVDELLDVTRISRGHIEVQAQPVDVTEAIERALDASRPLIISGDHKVSLQMPPEPLVAMVDPLRLEQMLTNLLDNAAKYMDRGGRITIGARREDGEVVIRVEDTGMGIAPEMIDRIFEMFTQLDVSLDRARGGLGVGLPLARQLAELHGGSLRAESDGPGKGSRFTLRLPAAKEQGSIVPAAARVTPPRSAGALRVLFVDDNVTAVDLLAEAARMRGHETQVAYDGLAAVEAAKAFEPDIIFLDIGLPKLDGYGVALRIRKDLGMRDVFIVALSGFGMDDSGDLALRANIDRHLIKPIALDTLDEILSSRPRRS